jgi:hypothetical protein
MNFTPMMGNASFTGITPTLPLAYSPTFVQNEVSNLLSGTHDCGPVAPFMEMPLAHLNAKPSLLAGVAPQAVFDQPDVSTLQQPAQAASVAAAAITTPQLVTDVATMLSNASDSVTTAVASLPASLIQALPENAGEIVDLEKLPQILDLAKASGFLVAANVAAWFISKWGASAIEKFIQASDKIAPLAKRKFHTGLSIGRAVAIAAIAVGSSMLVSESIEGRLAGIALSVVVAGFFLTTALGAAKTWVQVKMNDLLKIGNYIGVGADKGFLLYTGLTHSVLVDLLPQSSIQEKLDKGELGHPIDVPHNPTQAFPSSLFNLLAGRVPDFKIVPNSSLIGTIRPITSQEPIDKEAINWFLGLLDGDRKAPNKAAPIATVPVNTPEDSPVVRFIVYRDHRSML